MIDEAIVVGVESKEHLTTVGQFLALSLQVGNDRTDTTLEVGQFSEGGQIRANVQLGLICQFVRSHGLKPGHLENLSDGWPISCLFDEASLDDIEELVS